ncbi:MAG: ROK family protein [Aristaeellaceae bacterium]
MPGTLEMTELKRDNRMAAFSMLIENESLTRSDVCASTGLSTPTVMKIFDFFERQRLVLQVEGQPSLSAIGRRPVHYCLNSRENLALCLSYRGGQCIAGYVALGGEIVRTVSHPCSDNMARFVEEELYGILDECLRTRPGEVKCIGIALPAIVTKSEISYAPYYGISRPLPLQETQARLQERYRLPVIFENDTNAAAVGEFSCRRREGIRNMAYIALNEGVGAGLILNQQLYRGSHSFSGEIGYLNTDVHAFSSFGERGELERRLDQQTMSRRWPQPEHSDEETRDMIGYMADHLALALSNMQCILDLNLFVLGGDRVQPHIAMLTEAVNTRLRYLTGSGVACVSAECQYPVILGTAQLSRDTWLNELFCMD